MSSNAIIATQEQQEIFDYKPFDMVITAPAGCGKTEALAYRAKGLLERFDFSGNGRKLLIISFTNQARDNILERLKKYMSIQTLRQHVTICNFHGLAARIIKAHGGVVGLDGAWEVASFDWARKAIQMLDCDKKTRKQVESALKSAKLNCLSDDEVMEKLKTISEPVGPLVVSIEKTRVEQKIVTYDDQIRVALWILQDKKVAELYRNHFFAALVDEFQDLTLQQLQLVKALCGNDISYAGDLAQSIFSFAGADASYTYREISRSTNKQVKLLKSFRSAPAVLDAVNSLSPLTGSEKLTAAFPAHWGDGGLSAFASFKCEDDEALWIVRMAQVILGHCPNQRVGIIARTASRAKAVKRTLVSEEIDFINWENGVFRPEIAKTLRSICDDMEDGVFDNEWDIHRYITQRAVVVHGAPSEELKNACTWLSNQILQYEFDFSKIKRNITERKGNETIATLSGIHCLTGHAGKGQQFDWVFIVGLEKGSIPFCKATTKDEVNEEARVLSVMISRARIGFIATFASVDMFNRARKSSEFLHYLQAAPGFISGSTRIEEWYTHADWPAFAQM